MLLGFAGLFRRFQVWVLVCWSVWVPLGGSFLGLAWFSGFLVGWYNIVFLGLYWFLRLVDVLVLVYDCGWCWLGLDVVWVGVCHIAWWLVGFVGYP